jgi:hypothetical protein
MRLTTSAASFSVLVAALAVPVLLVVEVEWSDGPAIRMPGSAHAIVGAPMTPMSVAGVAGGREDGAGVGAAAAAAAGAAQQQAVAQQQAATAKQQQATAQQQAAVAQQQQAVAQQQAANAGATPAIGTVVQVLPSGCTTETQGDVQYYRCGSVYYRAAFQANTLVYVVQPKP